MTLQRERKGLNIPHSFDPHPDSNAVILPAAAALTGNWTEKQQTYTLD